MLRRIEQMYGFKLQATDGDIGSVEDFYFDPETWELRYTVVMTGAGVTGRRVLISPEALHRPDWDAEIMRVSLTRQQVKDSPEVDLSTSVSAEELAELHAYYGWPWWSSPLLQTGPVGTPLLVPPPMAEEQEPEDVESEDVEAPRLRSTRQVSGYRIHATDGDIGHTVDFFMDTANWLFHYLLVDTGDWLPGRKVLVSTDWVEEIQRRGGRIRVDLEKEEVRDSPEYDFTGPVDREYETLMHQHYRRQGYWQRLGH